ncbi:MAG: cellulose biosynthesis protein BcsS [Rhodobiaceae bacterium]|nr:cellulose biosynthesis protein BcsS [Rhodobiaceae bacterium]MCC0040724.1 cellulose biosynthesis protein BcsS [Rhodobiaceae bacterium]MCC0053551.1 cellulose biosynthesis protein BcsS [Rhodobiaceae bacterium]
MSHRKLGNFTRCTLAACLAGVGVSALPVDAGAADKMLGYANGAYDTVIYGSFDFSHASSDQNGYGADAGFVTAINGDITTTGWTLTANVGVSRSNDVATDTTSFNGSVLGGYQWHTPAYYFALNAGVHFVNNDDNPSGGPTDGSEAGVIAQYGFETKAVDAFYVQSYGALSSVYDQIYFHAKAGWKTQQLKYGAEFTASDEKDSGGTLRYGAFIGDIPLGMASVGISAGFQQELEAGKKDGFYSMVEMSMPLDIR